jgi:hypothetical protein
MNFTWDGFCWVRGDSFIITRLLRESIFRSVFEELASLMGSDTKGVGKATNDFHLKKNAERNRRKSQMIEVKNSKITSSSNKSILNIPFVCELHCQLNEI